jgi:hypothetical protein
LLSKRWHLLPPVSSKEHSKALLKNDILINTGDAPDIRPDNPAFFDIRYPAGYQIALPDIRPDIRYGRITGCPAGYPTNVTNPKISVVFIQKKART